MVGANGFCGRLAVGVGGLMMRHQVRSIQHSMQHSELRNPYSILRLSQVGLTVPVGRGLKDTDQQGRWSLPGV